MQDGGFREDLYFRLNGAALALPALRERRDHAALIEAVFVEEAHRGGARIRLAASTRACLAAHLWPGNIRELRHAMRYVVALVDHGEVRPEHLPPFIIAQQPAGGDGQGTAGDSLERQRIVAALKRSGRNITTAARLLGWYSGGAVSPRAPVETGVAAGRRSRRGWWAPPRLRPWILSVIAVPPRFL